MAPTDPRPRMINIYSVPACKRCGSRETREGPGSPPHYARLDCASCGGFLKWLGKPWEPSLPLGKASAADRKV